VSVCTNAERQADTGWAPAETNELASNILTLWGMADLGTERTDVCTLSMSYDPKGVGKGLLKNGSFGIATRDAAGNWVNAVDMNYDGFKNFVAGP